MTSSAGGRDILTSSKGLAATIEWYRDHEDWWAPAKDATEAFYARLGQ